MNKWGIKAQALLLALVPAIIIAVSLLSYFLYSQLNLVNLSLDEQGTNTARHLAFESQYGIFSGNLLSLKRHTDERILDKNIRSITILNKEKFPLVHSGEELTIDFRFDDKINNRIEIPSNNSIVFIAPITPPQLVVTEYEDVEIDTKKIIGWSLLELSLDSTDIQINAVIINALIITIMISFVSVFMAILISRNVTRPILSLSAIVKDIADGKLSSRAEEKSGGELRILETGINKMARGLLLAQENLQSKIDIATFDLKETLELLQLKNKELESAKKEAIDASEIKSSFLAHMSHEIRTPINGIIGFTDLMMKSGNIHTQDYHHLEMIKISSVNLLALVDDILDITRIEAGELNITTEKMNLHDCIEQVIKMMAPSTFDKELELILLYYSDVQEEFFGDPLRISQIMSNLLGNAIKFTEHGSITIRVMIEDDDNEISLVKFSVTDTGIGIPENQYNSVFRPFIQGDNSTTKKYGGSGLGLSIVQNLVERMGGEIGFDSKVNIGTTLWFTLPLIKNNDGAQLLIPDSIKGKSIALIDQNPTSRLSIKHMLTDAGISVHEYTDIAKTTSIFKSQPDINLDAVIISCNKLSMRLITSSLLNEIHELTHSEILVLVPTNDNKTILSITKTGADLCVSKPVFRDRLYQTLSGLLNKKSFPEYETKEPDITTSKNICNLNVLIAEDNEINATLLSAILKQHGSTISIASNGKIVLDLLSSSRFDVILMDINMPVLDGINTTKMIRENCEYYPCNIPIIAITANALEKDRVRFKTAGINDLLIKPITEEAVWEAIMKHVKCDCTIDDFITDDISKLIPDDLYSRVKIEVSEHTQIIITALKQNDMDTLFTHAHKLNGLASYFNIPAVREVVDKLETALKNKNGRTEIESYVERLHSEVAKIDN